MSELAPKHAPGGSGAPHQAAPHAPKPPAAAPRPKPQPAPAAQPRQASHPPARVPAASELLAPAGEPSLEGVDAATLTAIIGSYVKQIYGDFRQAHREAFAALHEPPPPADQSFALAALEQLVGALASYATGGLSSLVSRAVEDRLGADARAALAKGLAAAAGAATKALAKPARPAELRAPGGPAAPSNPAAPTLLAEFESRQEESLRDQEGRAERGLLAAGAAMSKADPGALRTLAGALARKVEVSSLRAEYIRRVCTGWLQLCSAISLGPRAEGATVMPGANRVGGSPRGEWRRAHAGFLEIEVDFPEEVDGLVGAAVGAITLAGGPGAVRILRQSGRTLGELAVYRRLWLGAHRLDRSPDLVITPDHELEVNASSSLLAAIATGTRGRLRDLTAQGPGEERERERLLERPAPTEAPPPAHHEPGRLGPLVDAYRRPTADERTAMDERRLALLGMRRQVRAVAALHGASTLWEWVGATSTDKLS